jgi:hypothetical protein
MLRRVEVFVLLAVAAVAVAVFVINLTAYPQVLDWLVLLAMVGVGALLWYSGNHQQRQH